MAAPATHARRQLLKTEDVTVEDYACRGHGVGWTVCKPSPGYSVVLVRRGAFRRRVRDAEVLVDPAVAFFNRPDDEEEVSHPVDGGDDDTIVSLSSRAVSELRLEELGFPRGVVYTTPKDQLRHRMLLAACRAGGSAEDAAVSLIASFASRVEPGLDPTPRPSTLAARRRLVDRAREALAAEPDLSLLELARAVSSSPHHLSRTFSAVTGQTLSTYRRRLRLGSALERLREGDEDLASVAADAGFADHAHLTRTFRRELGDVPSRVRHLVGPSPRWS